MTKKIIEVEKLVKEQLSQLNWAVGNITARAGK